MLNLVFSSTVARLCPTDRAGPPRARLRRTRARRWGLELQQGRGRYSYGTHAPGGSADHDERERGVRTARYGAAFFGTEESDIDRCGVLCVSPATADKPNFKQFSQIIKDERENTQVALETLLGGRTRPLL